MTDLDIELAEQFKLINGVGSDDVESGRGSLAAECSVLREIDTLGPNPKPKKVISLVKKLYFKETDPVKLQFYQHILQDKDPVEYIEKCRVMIHDFALVTKNLIDRGFHGKLTIDNIVIPVKIDTQKHWLEEGKRWHIDDEITIMREVVNNFMDGRNLDTFKGEVILFPHFGFSGHIRVFELTRK